MNGNHTHHIQKLNLNKKLTCEHAAIITEIGVINTV